MLEWYRAFAGWEAVADDVAALCAELAASRPGAMDSLVFPIADACWTWPALA